MGNKVSCNNTSIRCSLAAAASGIGKVAGSAANGAGAGAKQASQWAKENKAVVKAVAAGSAIIGVAAAVITKGLYQKQGGVLEESGVEATVERTGFKIGDQDLAIAGEVDRGLAQLQRSVGSPVFERVRVGGYKLATANMLYLARLYEINATGGFGSGITRGIYKVLKPTTVGQIYLLQRGGRFGYRAPTATTLKSHELVVNSQYIKNPQEVAYRVAAAGLQRAQVDASGRLSANKRRKLNRKVYRQSAKTQAAARLMVDHVGRAPKGYKLASRVAEWNARRIAQVTGRDPVEVVLSGMKIKRSDLPTSKPNTHVFRSDAG
jgi:hypothetical protein